MINRRNSLLLLAAASALPGKMAIADMQFLPETILGNLEKSVWLSTNRSASQAVYVVAAPWCPFCKQLYDEQKSMQLDIDFRYIFLDFRQFGGAVSGAYFSDVDDQVGLFYEDTMARNPALTLRTAEWIDYTNTVSVHMMAPKFRNILGGANAGSNSGAGFGFPTLVHKNQSGRISAILGSWMYLNEISNSNATLASAAPSVARYADLLRNAPEINRIRRNFFASESNTPFFAAPVGISPQVKSVDKGSGFPMVGTLTYDGEEWVAAEAFKNSKAMIWARKSAMYSR